MHIVGCIKSTSYSALTVVLSSCTWLYEGGRIPSVAFQNESALGGCSVCNAISQGARPKASAQDRMEKEPSGVVLSVMHSGSTSLPPIRGGCLASTLPLVLQVRCRYENVRVRLLHMEYATFDTKRAERENNVPTNSHTSMDIAGGK